jgi:enoyl-CoA hydratase
MAADGDDGGSMTTPASDHAKTREPAVLYSPGGKIGVLTLNRPDTRNALSAEMLVDFHKALDALQADERARVCILKGAGPTFCSGFDLTRTSDSVKSTQHDPWKDRDRLLGWIELSLRIWEFPRPIIAQVQGNCLAGGVLLLLCSDLVFVEDSAVIGWPRLPMGAGFMDGAMSHLIGQRRAKEISYVVGSRITGAHAAEWGLANFAYPPAELEAKTLAFAKLVAKAPRSVLEIRKAAITRAQKGMSFRESLLAGVEWDALAHADPAVNDTRRLVREHGMKAVIDAFENTDDYVEALDGKK